MGKTNWRVVENVHANRLSGNFVGTNVMPLRSTCTVQRNVRMGEPRLVLLVIDARDYSPSRLPIHDTDPDRRRQQRCLPLMFRPLSGLPKRFRGLEDLEARGMRLSILRCFLRFCVTIQK